MTAVAGGRGRRLHRRRAERRACLEHAAALPARLGAVDRRAALLGAVALVAVLAWNVPLADDGPRSATVTLRDVDARPGPDRRRRRPDRPAGSRRRRSRVPQRHGLAGRRQRARPARADRAGRATGRPKPIPVHGGWKATLRVQQGSSLVAVPIYQPEDRAIPAPETPATRHASRAASSRTSSVLQRERKLGCPECAQRRRVPDRAGDRAVALRADRLVAAAGRRGGPRRAGAKAGPRRLAQNWFETNIKRGRHLPNHLVASPPRRIRGSAERGNQRWLRPLGRTLSDVSGGAQALSARARQLTPQAFERECLHLHAHACCVPSLTLRMPDGSRHARAGRLRRGCLGRWRRRDVHAAAAPAGEGDARQRPPDRPGLGAGPRDARDRGRQPDRREALHLRRRPQALQEGRLDAGYDCSGAVSYALYGGRFLRSPLPSGALMRLGRGRPGPAGSRSTPTAATPTW